MVTKICRDCKKEFEAKSNFNKQYVRKYCDKCAKERKKSYENIHTVCASDCDDE
ncbi:MAG: hypothetical protein AABX17_00300 [Nanoarchaeota archaeon]